MIVPGCHWPLPAVSSARATFTLVSISCAVRSTRSNCQVLAADESTRAPFDRCRPPTCPRRPSSFPKSILIQHLIIELCSGVPLLTLSLPTSNYYPRTHRIKGVLVTRTFTWGDSLHAVATANQDRNLRLLRSPPASPVCAYLTLPSQKDRVSIFAPTCRHYTSQDSPGPSLATVKAILLTLAKYSICSLHAAGQPLRPNRRSLGHQPLDGLDVLTCQTRQLDASRATLRPHPRSLGHTLHLPVAVTGRTRT